MKFLELKFLVTVLGFIALGNPISAFGEATTSELIVSKELLFSDCNQAKDYLDKPLTPISISDKENLTGYLERILGLEQPSHQYLGQKTIGFNPGSHPNALEMSHLLDPERDIKAKLCALEIIPKIYPQSTTLLPKLLEISGDKKNDSVLIDNSFNITTQILSLIQKPEFSKDLIIEIAGKIKKDNSVLHSKLSIPILVALAERLDMPWVEMLQTQDPILRANITSAIVINSLNNSSSPNSIPILLQSIDDGAKAQLLLRLRPYVKQNPRLLEELPTYLSSQSELVRAESFKLLKHLASHPSLYASYYTTHSFSDMSMEKYIALLKDGNDLYQKEILKALLNIELKPDSTICSQEIKLESPGSTGSDISIETAIYLLKKSICPLNISDKEKIQDAITKGDINDLFLNTSSIIRHGVIDEKILELLIKKLKIIKSKYSAKEYNQILQITLTGAVQINPTKLRAKLIDLAIDGLGLDLDYPPLMAIFIQNTDHPSISYLAANYTFTESHLEKLLKDKSPLIKKNALSILSKSNSRQNKLSNNITHSLIKLLNDEDLEIRRSSYLTLKDLNPKDLNLMTKFKVPGKNRETFYLSRINLDHPEALSQKEIDVQIESFTNSLEQLDCKESTVQFPTLIKNQHISINPIFRAKLEDSQAKCLQDPSNSKARALKNLISISPINNKILLNIADNRLKIFKSSTEKSTVPLTLDLLDSQGFEINAVDNMLLKTTNANLEGDQAEDIIFSTLTWFLQHPTLISHHKDRLLNLTSSSTQEIAILSSILMLSMDSDLDTLDKLRSSFNKNIESAKELLLIDISNLPINTKNLSEHISTRSPYFSIFLNSILCNSQKDPDSCGKILPNTSLLLDRPDFIASALGALVINGKKTSPEVRSIEESLIELFISTGYFDEITPLLKHAYLTEILSDLRKKSTNLAHSKILDYLLEY